MKEKALLVLKKAWPFLLCIVVGVLAGWYMKPAVVKVEEREKIVTHSVVDENLVQQAVEARVKEITANMTTNIQRVYITKPDGTKTVTENIEKTAKTTEKQQEVKTVEKVVTRTEYVDKIVEREKIVTPVLEQWKLGLMVGASPPVTLDFGQLAGTPVLLGISASRRIAGPFWLDAGLMAGVQFNGVTRLGTIVPVIGVSATF